MKSISFANPFLLLIFIPLLLAVVIPFAIAIRRENRSKSVAASLVIHIIISLLFTLSAAGMEYTANVTKTQVIVVADLSYSSHEKLDTVDEYIANIKSSLPNNSEMGVVVFGKSPVLYVSPGDTIRSVKDARVDDSETNITKAVKYASALFTENVVKRIVLITDGMDTSSDGVEKLTALVEELHTKDIGIDAMYVDSNVTENSREVQISGVTFSESTYLNHKTRASVLVESSTDTGAIITLRDGEDEALRRAVTLKRGFNVVNLDLPTDKAGVFDYTVEISSDADTSTVNNVYPFTQRVSEDLNILFISGSKDDLLKARELYGERANIDAYMLLTRKEENDIKATLGDAVKFLDELPYTVESLCIYDEIMISNADVSEITNISYFIDVVGKVVSEFGKSLVTLGDINIQNSTDDTLRELEEMLPVRYGNSNQEPKLFGIVIDCSRSMYTASRLTVAKDAATYIINMLNDGDYVAVIKFAGESFVVQSPIDASNRDEIAEKIYELVQPEQGTFIGGGLQKTYEEFLEGELASMYSEKQIILISDGLTFTSETADAAKVAADMYEEGIVTSVINPYSTEKEGVDLLQSVAAAGGGSYYYIESQADLEDIIFGEIADDLTESIVEGNFAVNIERHIDDVLDGVTSLPNINGYVQAKAKATSTVVLTVEYKRASGSTALVPLYAYRDYGNGTVTSITTSLSGDWTGGWTSEGAGTFMQNILSVNTPDEKNDYPFRLNVDDSGDDLMIEVVPIVLNPQAITTAVITLPSGKTVTAPLAFDSEKYLASIKSDETGKYSIDVSYSYLDVNNPNADSFGNVTYSAMGYYNVPYSREYDSFAAYSPALLTAAIRHRGVVTEDGTVDLTLDENRITTYNVKFAPAFMIAAVVLFVIDVFIRKIKLADIKSLFERKKKGV